MLVRNGTVKYIPQGPMVKEGERCEFCGREMSFPIIMSWRRVKGGWDGVSATSSQKATILTDELVSERWKGCVEFRSLESSIGCVIMRSGWRCYESVGELAYLAYKEPRPQEPTEELGGTGKGFRMSFANGG